MMKWLIVEATTNNREEAMIIDTFSGLPDPRCLRTWLITFGRYEGYVKMFASKFAPSLKMSPEEMIEAFARLGPETMVDKMFDAVSEGFMELDTYVQVMDALEVQAQGVWMHVFPGNMESQPAVQALADARKRYPDRFFALPSFDLSDDLPDRVARLHQQIGLAGVTTLAFADGVFPDDARYRPLYEKLLELDLVLWNHTVNSWSAQHVSEYGHPRYVDRIACEFPELRIVMGHGGWPWVLEAVAVARRHPNVYIEPSSHRWKHLSRPGSGWEPLMYYGDWIMSDKVLFASIWQLQGLPLAMVIDEVKGLPLSEKSLRKWTFENAKRLYRL